MPVSIATLAINAVTGASLFNLFTNTAVLLSFFTHIAKISLDRLTILAQSIFIVKAFNSFFTVFRYNII